IVCGQAGPRTGAPPAVVTSPAAICAACMPLYAAPPLYASGAFACLGRCVYKNPCSLSNSKLRLYLFLPEVEEVELRPLEICEKTPFESVLSGGLGVTT